jgi:glycosyltransferase involved in cell wall biosynthesis
MKIGVMLRHFEQKDGGVRVYTQRLLPLLFSFGSDHEFVLMYQNPRLIGTYRKFANVSEVCLRTPGTVLWDQIAVPWAAARHQLDLVFNPKFTVPMLGRAKKVFVLHGSEWFAIPDHFLWYDRLYLRCAVPLYFRAADSFIAVSAAVKGDAVHFTGVPENKVTVVHNGFDANTFTLTRDALQLQRVAAKYRLPRRFILWVGQLESRKNIRRLLQAFALIKDRVPHDLVLAGAQRFAFPMAAGVERDLKLIHQLSLQDRVHFPGWIPHEDLPSVYALADLFAFPSLHEGFGIPLLEAMACGCPILTANTCAPPEVVGDAALLVDPLDVHTIAEGMFSMVSSGQLTQAYAARGLKRVREFGWNRCALAVLALFESLTLSTGSRTGIVKSSQSSAPGVRGPAKTV